MSENKTGTTTVVPTLGLTGVTVNAMALIAPGAFLWITYQLQAAGTAPNGASVASDIWAGIGFALILAFLTAISYAQLAKLYPEAGFGSCYYFAEKAFLDRENKDHHKWARIAKIVTGWAAHLFYWVYPGVMVAFMAVLVNYIAGQFGLVLPVWGQVLIAFTFIGLGLVFASRMKDMHGFQLVMNFVVFPFFFLSGAIFPLPGLTGALATVAKYNPLSYGIDAFRGLICDRRALSCLEIEPVETAGQIEQAVDIEANHSNDCFRGTGQTLKADIDAGSRASSFAGPCTATVLMDTDFFLHIGDLSVEKEWTFAGDIAEAVMILVGQDAIRRGGLGLDVVAGNERGAKALQGDLGAGQTTLKQCSGQGQGVLFLLDLYYRYDAQQAQR